MAGRARLAWMVAGVATATITLPASQPPATVESCVVVLDVAAGRITRSREPNCATRLPPASTFKIPHALLSLETGVVTATSVEPWDGTAYPGRPAWQRNHTVVSALRPSVVWFFQRIAPRVGADRMHAWLTRVGYGNADTSGPVTHYWLNGRLRVSPDEQVRFLRGFYDGTLPVAARHVATVESSLQQDPGRVENASGSHLLDVGWRDGLTLSAKTGATTADDGTSVSWLVGARRDARAGRRGVVSAPRAAAPPARGRSARRGGGRSR